MSVSCGMLAASLSCTYCPTTVLKPSAYAACAGQWEGAGHPTTMALPIPPDLGPGVADARDGVCTVGAAPLVVNFNLPLAVRLNPALGPD